MYTSEAKSQRPGTPIYTRINNLQSKEILYRLGVSQEQIQAQGKDHWLYYDQHEIYCSYELYDCD